MGDLLRKVNAALPEGRWEACPVAVGRDLHFQGSNPTCICKACKNCHFNIIHLTIFRKKKKHHNDMSFGHLCQSLLTSWWCRSPGPRTTSSTLPPSHLNKKVAGKNIFFSNSIFFFFSVFANNKKDQLDLTRKHFVPSEGVAIRRGPELLLSPLIPAIFLFPNNALEKKKY